MRSHVWMAIGLAAGLIIGLLTAATQQPGLVTLTHGLRPVGAVFLNLLSMVVIPLVATALFSGIASLGDLRALGRLGVRTLAIFWTTTVAAIVIGFALGGAILPLGGMTPEAQASLRDAAAADSGVVRTAAQMPSTTSFLVDLVPANVFRAAAEGRLLALIAFVTIFAVATASLPEDERRTLTRLSDVVTRALIRIVYWVLALAPIGIFALVASSVAQFGWSLVKAMAVYVLAVAVAMSCFVGLVLLPTVALAARLGVRRFLRAAFDSMLMAFSTTSSLATLPTMLTAAQDELGVSPAVAGFVLPLGASVNRPGSALFQAVALLFTAQLYGLHLGVGQLVEAGAAVFLASLTVAAVPAASVVSLAPAFAVAGLPMAGLALLIGLDRIPDMLRTTANVIGHLSTAAAVSAREGRAAS